VSDSGTQSVVYLIDTCVWVSFNDDHVLTDVLAQLSPHAQSGRVKTHSKVLDELKRRWKHIHKEVKKMPLRVRSSVEMSPDVVLRAGRILHENPFLGRALSPQNHADPWIIATAEVHGWTVVTDDGAGRRPSRSLMGVCKKRGVAVIDRRGFASALDVELWPE
jgi:predicted nucleic acid-binding protein